MPPKRVQFTQAEVDNQLHQLGLYSSLELQLAPLILNIHRSQQQHHYLDSLNQFVQAKEAEIQQVCIDNYQDFVQSVSSLLRVRQGTVSLKHRVVELNDQVQLSGRGVADKKRELVQMRRVGSNIDEAIDTIQACLRVLDMASKVSSLIRNRKFFSALRVRPDSACSLLTIAQQLEDLQQTHLKPILHYPFASLMLTSIPSSRNEIRDSVTKSLKAWMYEARNASQAVGRGALDAMEARGRRWNARKRKEGSVGLARVNGPIELGVSERHECPYLSLVCGADERTVNVLDNDNVKVDFKPLYQCIHIYETLDALPELQSSYQSDRRVRFFSPGLRLTPPGASVPPPLHALHPLPLFPVRPAAPPRRDCRLLPHRVARRQNDKVLSLGARCAGSLEWHVRIGGQNCGYWSAGCRGPRNLPRDKVCRAHFCSDPRGASSSPLDALVADKETGLWILGEPAQ